MFEKILVPLDGSQLAELALQPALTIARQAGSNITLLNVPVRQPVVLPSSAGYGPPVYDRTSEHALKQEEQYLERVRDENAEPEIDFDIRVEEGDVAGVIIDTAVVCDVDLILMTTHGYSGFTRWMLGSVTERVLREAPCPVLVIRRGGPLRNAVITLDGSRLAEQALLPGVETGRLLGCETSLIRVDEGEKLSSVEMGFLEVASSDLCQDLSLEDADRVSYYLDCVVNQFGTEEYPLRTAVVRGKPAESILEYIEEQQIDLVAIATHGYGGLKRWTYGSVTEKILRKADCAMLVVRPPADALN
jgi:nucleotide-binding universal stress UspA family protein